MTKIAESGSGSISQRPGSADLDPDPHQNVMDIRNTGLKYDVENTIYDANKNEIK